ncbi:TetR/AcrR family transcriptional regulator [Delftia tsuruhatensis]|uniref:TetR/AcrR family transcriptional regulator n=1 Tax=Delftia tsuruhatensis TaxID=180282 RepID=UPI0030CD7C32
MATLSDNAPSPQARSATRKPTAARLRKELNILQTAELHFAQYGFEGASLEMIAHDAGLSRHNLLYYFASKEELYLRVLGDVLTQWLAGMSDLLRGDDPAEALRIYIRAKLQSSRERPHGSRVFTREVMAGAPRFGQAISSQVGPALAADVQAFERWVAQGKIARVDFTHLMFILWSVTQAYADQQAQFALLLGRPELTADDYDTAADLIYRLVIRGLQPDTAALAQ